ncbi:MAG: radical SAM protein [Planctomycetes bacterium]|nr:radical SAM protein [Planctomycetota bacterium]
MARREAPTQTVQLDIHDHDRDKAGLTYVYPVVSRRARGVSIGVNLNPNNACNWRCVYCQVPGLTFGRAPEIDLRLLERELESMLAHALDPRWMETHVAEGARRLNDVALSGNGEPTSSRQLPLVVECIERVLRRFELVGRLPVVLITNGSLVHQAHVRSALTQLARLGGEVWFKVDAVREEDRERINGARVGWARAASNLELCARTCPTWVQTMVVDFDGSTMPPLAERAYVDALRSLGERGVRLRGVLLYGMARTSHQPQAPRLKCLPAAELEALGQRLRAATGLDVRVSV